MPGKNIGPTIGLGGEAEFRKQIKNINAELGVLQAQLDKSAVSFAGNEKSQEALSEKSRILAEMNSKLGEAVEATKKQYETAAAEYGKNSNAALKLEKDLLKLEKRIVQNNNEIKANSRAYDENEKSLEMINAKLGVLQAQLDKTSTTFAGNEKSQEALAQRSRILAEVNSQLEKAVEATKRQFDAASKEYGENSTAALKLEKDLIKLEKQITQNNIEIKKNSEALDNNGEALEENSEKADFWAQNVQNKFNTAKDIINGSLERIGNGLSKLNAMMSDSATRATDITIMAERAGLTTDRFQELRYASQYLGLEMNTLTDSVRDLGEKAFDAMNEPAGESAEMFRLLRVNVTDYNGSLKDSNTLWEETLIALGNMSNETEKNAVAAKLFGGAAKDLNNIMGREGASLLKSYAHEANNVGAVMNSSTLVSLKSLNEEQLKAQTTIQGVKDRMSAQLAPAFADMAEKSANLLVAYEPLITNALSWLLNNLPTIAQGAMVLTGALLAMKLVSTLVPLINLMNTSLMMTNGTLTMTNATLAMNPLVVIVTGIVGALGGLVAGIVLFSDKADETTDALGNMADEMHEAEGIAKELDKSMSEVANSINWSDIDVDFKARFAILGANSAAAFKEKLLSGLDGIASSLSQKISAMELSFSPSTDSKGSYTPVVIQNAPVLPHNKPQPINIIMYLDKSVVAEVLYDPLTGIAKQKGEF